MESKLVFDEIGDPRFGALADHLIRPEPVDLIADEAQVAALFRQVFGITERTNLPRVKTAFEGRARAAWRNEQDIREEHWQLVNEMIEAAIENGSLTDTVINFGRMMQDGLPLEKAAEYLCRERAAAD
jgi:hypothetical protein